MSEINLKNAFEHRDEVIERCKVLYKSTVKTVERLVESKSKSEFLQVLMDNFHLIYKILDEPILDFASRFDKSVAIVRRGDKYGFIKKNGSYLVEPKFDETYGFTNGYAAVRVGDKWGFIDKKGNFVAEPQFESVYYFSKRGRAPVKLNNEWFLINKKGQIIGQLVFS